MKPLLLDGRKFDVRSFVFIPRGDPFLVYVYEQIYFRASMIPFEDPLERDEHEKKKKGQDITNLHVLKDESPDIDVAKLDFERYIWSPDTVEEYSKKAGLDNPGTWVRDVLVPRIRRTVQPVMILQRTFVD